jgi:hypothetical protein
VKKTEKKSPKKSTKVDEKDANGLPVGTWTDGEYVVPLEPNDKKEVAKLKVKKFQGNIYIDIRKYYDEGTKPTQKGISMKPDLFEKLRGWSGLVRESMDLVTGKISSLTVPQASLASIMRDGSETSVTAELDKGHVLKVYQFKKMLLIDIRNYYNGGPTKKGISISPELFEKIVGWNDWKTVVDKLR